MTYIRTGEFIWESDGVYNGKFMAEDGSLHDSPDSVAAYEEQLQLARAAIAEAREGK